MIDSSENITLLGGGDATASSLKDALMRAPVLVAADGGANFAHDLGLIPAAVIGDCDSLTAPVRASLPEGVLHHIAEQDSTDFEKCLMRVRAPLIFGVGFLGARLDHQLAALSVLMRYPDQQIILIGPEDVVFAAPAKVTLDLPAGTRVSLFPMGPVNGTSHGLRWPIDGLHFAPMGQIGTSNEATGPTQLQFDGPGMVVILPLAALDAAVEALMG